MDEATRKKLRGYSVISDSVTFTPTIADLDPEFLPTFNIRALDLSDQRKVKFMYIDAAEGKKFTPKEKNEREDFLNDITQKSIVGAKNLIDLSKDEVLDWRAESGKEYIAKDLYESIPAILRALIMNAVLEINGLA